MALIELDHEHASFIDPSIRPMTWPRIFNDTHPIFNTNSAKKQSIDFPIGTDVFSVGKSIMYNDINVRHGFFRGSYIECDDSKSPLYDNSVHMIKIEMKTVPGCSGSLLFDAWG